MNLKLEHHIHAADELRLRRSSARFFARGGGERRGGRRDELDRCDLPVGRGPAQARHGLHPAVDGRRAEPVRNVQPQAGPRKRRRNQGHCHERVRHPNRRRRCRMSPA